jgi:hypothetical protein
MVALSISLFSQQLPLSTQPIIWLRADLGVEQNYWQNQIDTSQKIAWKNGTQPNNYWLNYNKTLKFDANTGPLELPYNPHKKGELKAYSVYQIWDSLHENGIWMLKIDSITRMGLSSWDMINTKKKINYAQTTSTEPYINSLSQSWRNQSVDTLTSKIIIAGTDSLKLHGQLGEFLYFDKKPNSNDNELIHTYLALKYGITLDRINYVSSTDDIIWNTKTNKKYNHEVAGIGRDNQLNIYQKQSTAQAEKKELTIYLGEVQIENEANMSQIPNMNYLIWGHNGKVLTDLEIDTNSGLPLSGLLDRKWRINSYGISMQNIGVNLKIEANKIDSLNNVELIICRNAADEFNIDSSEVYLPDSVDLNRNFYFKNIYFDIDHSGSDLFTFKISPSSSRKSRPENNQNTSESAITQFKVRVFPNPSHGQITLEIEPGEETVHQIEILDVNGKIIQKEEVILEIKTQFKKQIPVNGVYLINVSTKDETKTIKVVIN